MRLQSTPRSGRAGGEDFEGNFAGRRCTSKSSPAARHVQIVADAILWRSVAVMARIGKYSTRVSRALDRLVVRREEVRRGR